MSEHLKEKLQMRIKIGAIAVVAMLSFALAQPPTKTTASAPTQTTTAEQLQALMTQINTRLEANGQAFRVDYAEYTTPGDSGEAGQIVFFNNRASRQLTAHFVPGDPRRGGGTNISYIVDQAEGAIDGLTVAQTTAAIDRAMASWDNVSCSDIPITKTPDIPALDIGIAEFLNGLGGSPLVFADIQHAGWLPGGILGNSVIAVTFTFIFVDGGGAPTDVDGNGLADTAFREILYNNFFTWAINGNIDVETVALHEAGHGLSQGHDGALFQTTSNGKFHFSPRSVMNAGYTGVQQSLKTTDNGGHCSIWASWPN
jgi:hypothetical protein